MTIDQITYKVIGCALSVHKTLGSGFREIIYQRALAIELKNAGISFIREFTMPIHYKGEVIGERRVDFFVEDAVMVELKATSVTEPVHLAQAINYLEAYNAKDGLIINFGTPKMEYHRLFNKNHL
ncbi:MAG: GxxExxY protein [Bacteroidetes bacterium]|nr:GxxExxY protein [Bacteroidota bacterium]